MLDIELVRSALKGLPLGEQAITLDLLEKLERARLFESAQDEFLSFVKYMWPGFIQGHHHVLVAEAFEDIVYGKKNRVIVSMAPRHTKSEFASVYLPAWFLGKFPDKKIIQTSHTSELAVGFGRRVRNIIASSEFQEIFPGIKLSVDSKAAGRWSTNKGGEYFAIGVGGKLAGKGADILIIDDPHSEQEAVTAAKPRGLRPCC